MMPCVRHSAQARRRTAFTLVEVLVSVAIFAVALTALIQIFTVSSDVAGKTAANTDVTARAAAVRETLSDELSRIYPGFLVIESPRPTRARRETADGPQFLQLRRDRIVFLTEGDVDEYQSFTDPTRGDPLNPARRTASSSQALVYFGPGMPLSISTGSVRPLTVEAETDPEGAVLPASEWMFLHRSILLMLDVDPNTDLAWNPVTMSQVTAPGGMLNGGGLRNELFNGSMDAIVSDAASGLPASARTFVSLILEKNLDGSDLLSATPSIRSLWQPGIAPRNVTMSNPNLMNYFTRGGSTFIPRLADFRIEWTDGRPVDSLGADGNPNSGDENLSTRWFGLRPDPAYVVDENDLDDIRDGNPPELPYKAFRRQDATGDTQSDEAVAFGIAPGSQNRIEWSQNGGASGTDSAYRAIWRADTWAFRPKALRFTYRIYDEGDRLKQTSELDLDEDGDMDPDETSPDDVERQLITRYGRSFSIVVPLP